MNENEKNRIQKIYTNLALALLGLIAVYIVVSALIIKKVTIMYNIVIIVGLTIFWAIMDIVIPVKTQDFEGRTKEQMDAYKKYAAFDFLGYAGLMYFALAMQSNTSIYGALVYVVARMMKNRFRDEYEGVSEDDADEDESIVDAEGTVCLNTRQASRRSRSRLWHPGCGPEHWMKWSGSSTLLGRGGFFIAPSRRTSSARSSFTDRPGRERRHWQR